MEADHHDYYSFNRSMLLLAGMWPARKGSKFWLAHKLYNVTCVVVCVVLYNVSELWQLTALRTDTRTLVKNLSWALTHTVTAAKVALWYNKRDEVLALWNSLDVSSNELRRSDSDTIGELFTQCKSSIRRYTSIYFWLGAFVPVNACVGSLYNLYRDANAECEQLLPFTSYLPFSTDSTLKCTAAIGLQGLAVVYYGFIIISLDCAFVTTMHHLMTHCKALSLLFTSIRQRQMQIRRINHAMTCDMKQCLRQLQHVIKASETLEQVYSRQTLAQVLVTLVVFCTCLFLVTKTPVTSKSFVGEVTYMLAIQLQLSMYCWFGNELTLASAAIPEALYEGDWLSADGPFKRSMIITMIRMQRPITLTVGKFTPLTLNTLVTIFRGSYSFFAVLKNSDF